MTTIAFKVLTAAQWAVFAADSEFAGAPVDLADGYIHLSTAGQLDETIAKHFAAQPVYVAEIDLASYGDAVRWEASRGGDLFPHIYGQSLRMDTVVGVEQRAPTP